MIWVVIKWKNRSAAIVWLAMMVGVCWAQTGPDDYQNAVEIAHMLLRQWRVEEAASMAAELKQRFPHEPPVQFLEGMVCLHQGKYAEAHELITKAIQRQTLPPAMQDTVTMIQAVAKMWENFVEARSEHFLLRYMKGKDAVLVEDALDTLEKSYAAVGADLKCWPRPPILVEIYPDADSFCTASTLSKKDVERSGAIGICHFNRIMFTSPRALLRGYPWLDTLCHEYTHYVVIKKSHNSVPVWLHEGIAKYMECRWRRPTGGELPPLAQTTLAQALEQNQLVSFERMHPTLAKLDFQEAQTAYAQMTAMVDFIVKTGGPDALPQILDRAAKGKRIEDALAHTMKMDFKDFLASWSAYMRKLPLKKIPGLQIIKPKLTQGTKNVPKETGFDDCNNAEAQNFALLGDLLRGKGLWEAAVMEYEKALKTAGLLSPQIMNKVAQVLTSDHKFDRAETILNSVLETYPDFVCTYANLGQLYLVQNKYERATEYFKQALQLNPFDPEVRAQLAAVYSKLGRKDEAERQLTKLRIVLGETFTGEDSQHVK